jgi:hypothetical protein
MSPAKAGFLQSGASGQTHPPPCFVCHDPILFHELQRPDGTKRLVSLDYNELSAMSLSVLVLDFRFSSEIWAPTWSNTPKSIPNTNVSGITNIPAITTLKIYAGQPDPKDLTHFTFDYDSDGNRHTIDGWLTNADQIVLRQRP